MFDSVSAEHSTATIACYDQAWWGHMPARFAQAPGGGAGQQPPRIGDYTGCCTGHPAGRLEYTAAHC